MELLILALCLLGLAGLSCAKPQVAQLPEVKNCHYLRQIKGDSGYGKNYGWQPLAKYAVFSKAEKMAATHLVWVRFDQVGGFNGIAVANALGLWKRRNMRLKGVSRATGN